MENLRNRYIVIPIAFFVGIWLIVKTVIAGAASPTLVYEFAGHTDSLLRTIICCFGCSNVLEPTINELPAIILLTMFGLFFALLLRLINRNNNPNGR